MAKFSKKTGSGTVNLAGGVAYKQTDKLEFASILLTSFLKNQYYRSEDDTVERIKTLFKGVDKEFAAKAAIYARTVFGMRSVSHLVAAEIAESVKGQGWTKHFFENIVHRPDDVCEILACYSQKKLPIPNSLKKGFAKALSKFDAYQLAKYRGEGNDMSLVDVVNLVHPKDTPALKQLMSGELKSTETWESKISASGGDAKLKSKAWADLILERKIGYFALLRNLRNILNQAPEVVDAACELLVDEKLIRKSLVLPFRFLTAYSMLQRESGANKVLSAISKALDISFKNIPKFDGKTLVVVDHSGSMGNGYDSCFVKGAMMGIAMAKSTGADFMHFGDIAKYLSFNPEDSTLSIVDKLDGMNSGRTEVGHGTNFHSMFEIANKKYDRIMVFSDMQGWMLGGHYSPQGSFDAYKKKFDCNPSLYSFDLAGYGTMQFPEPNVFCMAGFSEKIFDLMRFLEKDKQALIHEIEAIQLDLNGAVSG